MASAKGIFPYSKAFSLSILLCEWLLGGGQRGQVCGSIRRKCKLVGDIDMVVSGPMEVALSKIIIGALRKIARAIATR